MSLFPAEIEALAHEIIAEFSARGHMVFTAESCTGGLIAGALTEIAGSSAVVDRGFVTYTNEAKADMLGVSGQTFPPSVLFPGDGAADGAWGAVRSRAEFAVAVTGIAGPGGGSAQKPVGLVHLAARCRNGAILHREMRYGDIGRTEIRLATIKTALEMLILLSQAGAE